MKEKITFVFIHSPLVGPFTWQLVQQEMEKRGIETIVAALDDAETTSEPYWLQHANSVKKEFEKISTDQKIVLVGHSGAGPILPIIRQNTKHTIKAYVFIDAGFPKNNESRLGLMKLQDRRWAENFHQELQKGKQFPTWGEEDLREIIPNKEWRQQLILEIKPRKLPFFIEDIAVDAKWPDAPCIYIKFTSSYDWDMEQASQSGWYIRELNVGHFHMLVDPSGITNEIIEALQETNKS